MVGNLSVSRDDCRRAISGLIEALCNSGLSAETSFLVYGSYFGKWRDGLSDLDGILYFHEKSPLHRSLRPKIELLQSGIASLYDKFPFLGTTQFFLDVFILDAFFSADGRFILFDRDWIDVFNTQTDHALLHGRDFMCDLNPVSLRNQNEFELTMGLHALRNYLLFEIPRRGDKMFFDYALRVLRFFKVLPRTVTIILGGPMIKTPECLGALKDYLGGIDYSPLIELWRETESRESLERFLKKWHKPRDETFIKCLECFELTLTALVRYGPMRSVR